MPPSAAQTIAVAAGFPGGRKDRVLLCDVKGADPHAATVDALARLQLAAKRRGFRVRMRGASIELLELVDLMGLSEILAGEPGPTP